MHLKRMIFFSSAAEIEAKEACEWLRAAGFPQYAQLFEGNPPPTRQPREKKPEKKPSEVVKP